MDASLQGVLYPSQQNGASGDPGGLYPNLNKVAGLQQGDLCSIPLAELGGIFGGLLLLEQEAEGPISHRYHLLQHLLPHSVLSEDLAERSWPMSGGRCLGPPPALQEVPLEGVRPRCCSSSQHLGACAAAAAAAAALSRFTPPTHHPDASNKGLQAVQMTNHNANMA